MLYPNDGSMGGTVNKTLHENHKKNQALHGSVHIQYRESHGSVMGIWASQLPATKQKEENMDTQFLVRKKKGGATSQDGLTNLVNQPEFLIYVSGTCECPPLLDLLTAIKQR